LPSRSKRVTNASVSPSSPSSGRRGAGGCGRPGHDEAAARLAAAEAELALRAEDRRVAGLRATDAGTVEIKQEIEVIDAELDVIDAEMAVAAAQGELARRYFERAMAMGADPVMLAAAASPGPCASGWQKPDPCLGSRTSSPRSNLCSSERKPLLRSPSAGAGLSRWPSALCSSSR